MIPLFFIFFCFLGLSMAQYNHNPDHYEPDGYAGGYEGGYDGEPGFAPHGGEAGYDDAEAVYEAGAGYGGEPGGYGAEPAGFGAEPGGYGAGNIGYGSAYDGYEGPVGQNYEHFNQGFGPGLSSYANEGMLDNIFRYLNQRYRK